MAAMPEPSRENLTSTPEPLTDRARSQSERQEKEQVAKKAAPPKVVWFAESLPVARQPLVWVLVAAGLGAVADRYLLSFSVSLWLVGCLAALVCWFVFWRSSRNGYAAYVLLLAVAMLMAAWHHAHWHFFHTDDIGLFAQAEKEPACVEAIVDSSVQILPADEHDPMQIIPQTDRSVVDLRLVGIRDADRWISATGKARLTVAGHLLGVEAGDRVRVFAQLQSPSAPKNPGQRDAAAYHRGERRLAMLHAGYPESVSVIDSASTAKYGGAGWFERLRAQANQLFARHLDPRSAGLASAMLLGSRSELDPELKSAFLETGMMHLLAISGLHVGLLAWFLFFTLQLGRVSPEKSAVLVAGVILFYAMLTDTHPPVIRATILVWVFCFAQLLKRDVPTFNSLAAAGLVVMILNPTSLFQVGTQLSFLAVAVILWFVPTWNRVVRKRLSQDPGNLLADTISWKGVMVELNRSTRQLILISLTIWLITLPLTMSRFHLISPLGPLINVVLWIPVTVALAGGFSLLVIGLICPPLAGPLAWLTNQTFHLIDLIVSQAAALPGSHYWVAGPSEWWLIGFYLLLGVGLFLPRRLNFPRWPRFAPIAWIGVGLFVAATTGPPKELRATFIAVGHGSSTLIQTTSGKNLLCDCGCLASGRFGVDTISQVLWNRGIRRLDGIVLSHADADHYNALPGLLKRFSVQTVYVPPQMFFDEPDRSALAALHRAIDEAGVPIREIQSGDLLNLGEECHMEVLHPAKRYALESNNANSMVLLVGHAGHQMLLTGDLQSPGIDAVLADGSIDCDVLLVPHHGSRNSAPAKIAPWCSPEYAIVSKGNDPLHPETVAAYERHGAKIYQTNKDGAVDVAISRNRVEVKPFARL